MTINAVMKVEGNRPVELRSTRVATRPGQGAPAFTVSDGTAKPGPQAPVAQGVAIDALGTLIAMQSIPEGSARRSKAAKRGADILTLLDELRDGLLAGHLSVTLARRLSHVVNAETDSFDDPRLRAILDDIDLRAKVELAKLELAGGDRPAGLASPPTSP